MLLEDYKLKKPTLDVRTDDDGELKTLQLKSENDLPFLKNPDMLIGETDLTSLSYLHEPGVLYNLQVNLHKPKCIISTTKPLLSRFDSVKDAISTPTAGLF